MARPIKVKVTDLDFARQKQIDMTDGRFHLRKVVDARLVMENPDYMRYVEQQMTEEFMATAYSSGDFNDALAYNLGAQARAQAEQQALMSQQLFNNAYQHKQYAQSINLGAPSDLWYSNATDSTTWSTGTTSATVNFDGWKQTYGSIKENVIRFFRLNKIVELKQGAVSDDPVDELRLKVARWLNPKEKYNFA